MSSILSYFFLLSPSLSFVSLLLFFFCFLSFSSPLVTLQFLRAFIYLRITSRDTFFSKGNFFYCRCADMLSCFSWRMYIPAQFLRRTARAIPRHSLILHSLCILGSWRQVFAEIAHAVFAPECTSRHAVIVDACLNRAIFLIYH